MISFQAFCDEHGGRPVTVDGRLLYPDGLITDLEADYVLAPAPTDRIGKAKARRRFLVVKINEEVKAFHDFKATCADRVDWAKKNRSMQPPPPNAVELLNAAKQRIAEWKAEVAEIDELLGEQPDAKARKVQQELEAERLRQIDAQMHQIAAISLD